MGGWSGTLAIYLSVSRYPMWLSEIEKGLMGGVQYSVFTALGFSGSV